MTDIFNIANSVPKHIVLVILKFQTLI